MSTSLEEHDYIGLSEASKMESSDKSTNNNNGGLTLNLKATELRLGLPGSESESESPERDSVKNNNLVSGAKRGFSDTINGGSGNWVFNVNGGSELEKMSQVSAANGQAAPATKAQVVGWPPIRSFRKNTMASNPPKNDDVGWLPVRTFRKNAMDTNHPLKNDNDVDAKSCIYVKVSMDGAPYLRKVDLNIYTTYIDLSSALEKMFSCFTIGSEYVLTYEDKDGDWMLVGDVPWDMFTGSCKRMRIMKSSEAIGLAPRAVDKCRNQDWFGLRKCERA